MTGGSLSTTFRENLSLCIILVGSWKMMECLLALWWTTGKNWTGKTVYCSMDVETMKELGRVYFKEEIPTALHHLFIPDEKEGSSNNGGVGGSSSNGNTKKKRKHG